MLRVMGGPGLKNLGLCHLYIREEHWTGLGLDWIRAMTNFVDFGLDPECKMFHKFRIKIAFGLS